MVAWAGKTALVTGASSGIGRELAILLAERRVDLVLVARSVDKLDALAAELSTAHGVKVHVIGADLQTSGSAATVFAETERRGLTVDLLVNNAGFGKWGEFLDFSPEVYVGMLSLNITTLVALTHAYLPGMVARGGLGVIHVASTAALVPVPYATVYAATKAFVLSFSEGLYGEYAGRGVHVMALCPGGTDTNFAAVANADIQVPEGRFGTAKDVAVAAIRGFEAGQTYVVPGFSNLFSAGILPRLLPRATVIGLVGHVWKKMAGK